MKTLLFCLLLLPTLTFAQNYPAQWFQAVPRAEAQSWEILPQDAKEGEVILSKRTELGVFSNFAATPLKLDGKIFASIEGLWQSLKYPDPGLLLDPRHKITDWEFTREQVEMMVGVVAKNAGKSANKIYDIHGLKDINWGEHFFNYTDRSNGSQYHYYLIKRALREKLSQNRGLWDLLMKTGCLKLMPDHNVSENDPPSYKYFSIFMELRKERQFIPCQD